MGRFDTPTTQAVIPAGAIWSRLCNSEAEDCVKVAGGLHKIRDEGTFDIFDYRSGYYFVDFHGYDGVHGFRGLARTRDFRSWETVTQGAILDRSDASTFKTAWDKRGPIGFGAGSISMDRGDYYLIAEAADKNLACTPGQNWVWGMFRTNDLQKGKWEHFSGNPFFTAADFPDQDPHPLPCNPDYAQFFTARSGKVYFHVSRPSINPKFNGIYLYELVFKARP